MHTQRFRRSEKSRGICGIIWCIVVHLFAHFFDRVSVSGCQDPKRFVGESGRFAPTGPVPLGAGGTMANTGGGVAPPTHGTPSSTATAMGAWCSRCPAPVPPLPPLAVLLLDVLPPPTNSPPPPPPSDPIFPPPLRLHGPTRRATDNRTVVSYKTKDVADLSMVGKLWAGLTDGGGAGVGALALPSDPEAPMTVMLAPSLIGKIWPILFASKLSKRSPVDRSCKPPPSGGGGVAWCS